MKILDTQTGDIHEYGTDGHDSLYVSRDGRTLSYYNLQNGDGSKYGDYRFVCDDNKIPSESETADARHANVYFNIGGWHKRPKARKTVKDPISLTIITDAFEFLAKQDMPSAWTPTETKAIYQFLMELQERRKE